MRSLVRFGCAALLVWSVAVSANAQDALARRVSLDLKAMAPAEAFKVLADAVGLRVVVDPGVSAPLDIVVRNVKARTALDTMCDSIDCRWSLANGTITVSGAVDVLARTSRAAPRNETSQRIQEALKRTLPAGTKFENVPLSEVVGRLATIADLQITVTGVDAAAQRVTADLSNLALMSALRRILEPVLGRVEIRLTMTASDAAGGRPVAVMIGFAPSRVPLKK